MRNPRRHQLLALLLVTACGESATVVDVDVDSIVLSPSPASVEVGLTLQFQASAFDASGTEIMGQTVTWESTVPGIATISVQGVATGMMAGSTQISATIGDETASQALAVSSSPCPTRTAVNLSPGGYASFAGNECLLLPAGSAGDLYRVAIARPDLIADTLNVPTVTLDISPILVSAAAGAAAETPSTRPAPVVRRDEGPKIDGTQALEHLRKMAATRTFHNALRLRERALGLDASRVLPSLASAVGGPPTPVDPPPASRNMFLDLTCSATAQTQPVQLIGFNDNLAIYQETAEWDTDPIDPADTDLLLAYYDSYAKDMIVAYWGALPDTDANGRMIVVTSPSLGENVAASVYSGDFFPASSCAGSNEGEVIYFSGDEIAALDDADPSPFALGVIAHEAKHVISLYNGIQRGGFNDLWIEEGTAEVSSVMSSRIAWAATGGPALGEPITRAAIIAGAEGGQATPEMSGLITALAGVVLSLPAQPNSVITDPSGAPPGHSFYFNSWHWHRFLGDAFGDAMTPQADAAFFRTLTSPSTPAGGASGEILLTGRSFDQLFEDFVVGVSLHQTGHPTTYEITTWDFLTSADVFATLDPPGSYPWPVTADDTNSWDPFASASYTGTMGPSGVRFHDFRSSGTASAQIHVAGADDGVIIVTRID